MSRSGWALVAILIATALLYGWRLGDAPIAVSNDEAHFSAHAHALATTGRDLNGVRLPLFVEMIDPLLPDKPGTAWWQPFLFYLTSVSLIVFPMSEWAIRLPMVLLAVVNLALLYLVVADAFQNRRLALAATMLMALTPSHFIMSRQAIDYLCPVPFVLAWLWCIGRFLRSDGAAWLAAAGAILGVGVLSHISGWALAPLFAVITVITLAHRRKLRARSLAAFAGGALLPAIAILAWLVLHPGVLPELVGRYGFLGVRAAARPAPGLRLGDRISLLWDYFNPSFLFFAGGAHPTQTTSRAGVFLIPVGVLIAAGLFGARARPRLLTPAIVWGFLAAPVPVVLVMAELGEYSIARTIMLVPFGILIAAHGIEWLWLSGTAGRGLLAALALMVPLQFGLFVNDYFTDYQLRAAPRFDGLNTRAVAEAVIARHRQAPVPAVYLSDDDLDSKAVRWRFHLWKLRQYDLWARTRYFWGTDLGQNEVPVGSLLVFFHNDPRARALLDTGAFSTVTTINHPAGNPASVILLRQR